MGAGLNTAKDSVYKLACESCFVDSEIKSMINTVNKSRGILPENERNAVKEFVDDVEKEMGKNIENMNNSQRISELNKLGSKEGDLTEKEMRYRDALWATAQDDPQWEKFRDNQAVKIANTIIKAPGYITTKNTWEEMEDSKKQNYIQNITKRQQDIFGDTRDIKVTIFDKEPERDNATGLTSVTGGIYNPGSNTLSVNRLAPAYQDFYSIINVSSHEYGGHGYQDYILENQVSFLKQNPQFSNVVNLLSLSYIPKTSPQNQIGYEQKYLPYGLYLRDPAERDAWNIGNEVEKNLKN